jgi:hypothetical protein
MTGMMMIMMMMNHVRIGVGAFQPHVTCSLFYPLVIHPIIHFLSFLVVESLIDIRVSVVVAVIRRAIPLHPDHVRLGLDQEALPLHP